MARQGFNLAFMLTSTTDDIEHLKTKLRLENGKIIRDKRDIYQHHNFTFIQKLTRAWNVATPAKQRDIPASD